MASAKETAPESRSAYLILDLTTGRTIAERRREVIDAPMPAPGSVMKVVALAAALESGTIAPDTRVPCRRIVYVNGHRLVCVHPRVYGPLDPARALAYSCNDFFATVATKLPRQAFDRAMVSLGLTPATPDTPLSMAALGLGGLAVSPRALVVAYGRLLGPAAAHGPTPFLSATVDVIRRGLIEATESGTAAGLLRPGSSLAGKTGTTISPGGAAQGVFVGVTPPTAPTTGLVVIVPGGAGRDAATVAGTLLQRLADASAPSPGQAGARASRSAAAASASRPQASRGPIIRVGWPGTAGPIIKDLPLDDYVAAVVSGERAETLVPAALDALAILARTYALKYRGRHATDGYDVCARTHCQALGIPAPKGGDDWPRTIPATIGAAAARTAGQVLTYGGTLADVFYSASCGGFTESARAVWPSLGDRPYLLARRDESCAAGPHAHWTRDIPPDDISRALRQARLRGHRLTDLAIVGRDESGRVTAVRVTGFEPEVMRGSDFRFAISRTLGWNRLLSTRFQLERVENGYRFIGSGFGHGVGLCEEGAAGMAASGASTVQILASYFPGAAIGPLDAASGPVVERDGVSVSAPSAARAAALLDRAVRARAAVAARLGVAAKQSFSIYVHPTIDSYIRHTHRPWWTAALTTGARVDLMPEERLRRLGTLDATLRHEIAHVVTQARLKGRPLWVKEGAAMYAAGEATAPATSSGCPSDDDLAHAVSAAALRQAYDEAQACFARAIRRGTPWWEVREK